MENIKKITEHTYGTHIYMKLEIDGKEYEVDCYLRNDGQTYKTTADGTEDREKVIEAFNQLYQKGWLILWLLILRVWK